MPKKPQPNATKQVLEALLRKERLTALEAFRRWHVMRLASIIYNLRSDGHDIQTVKVRNGRTTYAEYYLA